MFKGVLASFVLCPLISREEIFAVIVLCSMCNTNCVQFWNLYVAICSNREAQQLEYANFVRI
jgi:hypothetical protein